MRDKWLAVEESASEAKEESSKLTVESVDNHVYFYATVDPDRTLAMLKTVREADTRLRNEYLSRALPEGTPPTPIWLHIQSGGGFVFAGFSAADQLKRIESPVYSIVEGYCASAATFLSLACDKRYILPNAFMLIHQLSSFMWGKYEEFKDEVHLLDMIMDQITGFYTGHTKMKKSQIKKFLKRDSWFNAQECLELGLADEIFYPRGGK